MDLPHLVHLAHSALLFHRILLAITTPCESTSGGVVEAPLHKRPSDFCWGERGEVLQEITVMCDCCREHNGITVEGHYSSKKRCVLRKEEYSSSNSDLIYGTTKKWIDKSTVNVYRFV